MGAIGYEQRKAAKKAKKLAKQKAHQASMQKKESDFKERIARGPKVDHHGNLYRTQYQPVHGNENKTTAPRQYYRKNGVKMAKAGKLKKY